MSVLDNVGDSVSKSAKMFIGVSCGELGCEKHNSTTRNPVYSSFFGEGIALDEKFFIDSATNAGENLAG